MFQHLHFPILVINPHIGLKDVAGSQLADLFKALESEGFKVLAIMAFIAGQIARTAQACLGNLLPPFFKALLDYTGRASYSWHSPRHGGGPEVDTLSKLQTKKGRHVCRP
jgi:arginine decarboxylase